MTGERLRVLMIAPGDAVGGGIVSLVKTIRPLLARQVALRHLPSVHYRPLKDSGKISFQNLAITLSLYARYLFALIWFRPQILHLHTSQGIAWIKDTLLILMAKACRCRTVLHIHGGKFTAGLQQGSTILLRYSRWVLRQVDAVVVVSSEMAAGLSAILSGRHIYTFRNCIDVAGIKPRLNSNHRLRVNIVFVGRISHIKGAFDLIEALHIAAKKNILIPAWLVGDEGVPGDLLAAQRIIAEYGLTSTCVLTGPLEHEDLMDLYRQSDIFVLPSHYEGMPIALLEGMAAGLAAVATPVGGIKEIVLDGCNGFIIPVGDVNLLAERLIYLSNHPEICKEMGVCGRDLVIKNYNVHTYVNDLMDLYSRVSD